MAHTGNKHASRSAETRLRFIRAAQKLYASRSIDGVSLNEITVAAGQKNRNALQYHFGNKEGLIQAILDSHADNVATLRQQYTDSEDLQCLCPAEAAARVLVQPLELYIRDTPEGLFYVQMLSQLAAGNSVRTNPLSRSGLHFRSVPQLEPLMNAAMAHLHKSESRQRLFLVVSITFHSIADICRTFAGDDIENRKQRAAMIEQVITCITALLSAPARVKLEPT